jgi:hypothetical protein
MRLLNPCVSTNFTTYEIPLPNSTAARVPPNAASLWHPPSVEIDLNILDSHTRTCNQNDSDKSHLASRNQATSKYRKLLPQPESHTMSDDEDDNRPPTAKEQRKWKQLELDRERGLGLAYYYGGIPTSLNHDEWLRKERREKRAKERKRAESKMETMDSPEVDAEYAQSDGESSGGSTGTLKRMETNVCPQCSVSLCEI